MRGENRPVSPALGNDETEANCGSHCPWVNNCVANNNHRHFVFYVLCMELGVLAWVRLVLACKSYSRIV